MQGERGRGGGKGMGEGGGDEAGDIGRGRADESEERRSQGGKRRGGEGEGSGDRGMALDKGVRGRRESGR